MCPFVKARVFDLCFFPPAHCAHVPYRLLRRPGPSPTISPPATARRYVSPPARPARTPPSCTPPPRRLVSLSLYSLMFSLSLSLRGLCALAVYLARTRSRSGSRSRSTRSCSRSRSRSRSVASALSLSLSPHLALAPLALVLALALALWPLFPPSSHATAPDSTRRYASPHTRPARTPPPLPYLFTPTQHVTY